MKQARTSHIITEKRPPADLHSFIKRINDMEKIKIDRINELARISKTRELTEDEKAEQAALRAEYLKEFRAGLGAEIPKK